MRYKEKKGTYHTLVNEYDGSETIVHETLGKLSTDFRMQIDKYTGEIRTVGASIQEVTNLHNYRQVIIIHEELHNGDTVPNSSNVPTSTSKSVLDRAAREDEYAIRAAVEGTLSSMG